MKCGKQDVKNSIQVSLPKSINGEVQCMVEYMDLGFSR
jgi:hypothetical protein